MSTQSLPNNANLACTSLIIKDKSNNVYHGRTLEFSVDYPSYLSFYPCNTVFTTVAPDNSAGLTFTSKYNILGITMPASSKDDLCFINGFNCAGLAFAANMYSSSVTPDLNPEDYCRSIPVIKIGDWGLASFATVDEVKAALQKQPVWSPVLASIGNRTSPFHFIFYDKTGKSIVIEYDNKKLNIYDNPTGVLTNGPEFPWHLTNLNHYTMLTNKDVPTSTALGNLTLKQPDLGNSTANLPSDEMSVGRFVRAVYYSSFVNKVDNPDTALVELSHIMNKFDRPKNITVGTDGVYEYSEWTALADLSRGELFIRTYNDINYTKYSLCDFRCKHVPYHTQVI
ncbi:linear amide C-N hydrolase [Commensalibacter oyaizuii]|uniref:Linear amide C-N hydrolase n=1 Tax=Commensalibacter oyaizuii TaxID=3043873 RepID=A0ABT6Q4A4_9PROT|nr:linear amide C-N hydrolase [Commensalibacter sp. TBRC 16381]MDI2091803.1 linear amide C-N hydrolase [Commensalibacter sp. TBRC 16381]